MVIDLMNGGDLRFHITRKTMTEEAVRFWVAELACALRYVHKQGIVHRDLKPDNVLLDSEGHVHLADFVSFPAGGAMLQTNRRRQNVASEFSSRKKLHSRSGTLAYLAPEVYSGVGYLSEVDWWSLGVTFYECIYNRVRWVLALFFGVLALTAKPAAFRIARSRKARERDSGSRYQISLNQPARVECVLARNQLSPRKGHYKTDRSHGIHHFHR